MFHITFEMNIQLANALSEVSGVTGLAIIGQPIALDRDYHSQLPRRRFGSEYAGRVPYQ
jgi:hypothetical protein